MNRRTLALAAAAALAASAAQHASADATLVTEMKIRTVLSNADGSSYVVVLSPAEAGKGKHLVIGIGATEAISIRAALAKEPNARPMTHDLFVSVMDKMGWSVRQVRVVELKEGTFYGRLVLAKGEETMDFDARPSDCIAIAARAGCPIRVANAVLEEAGVTDEKLEEILPDPEPDESQ